MPIREEAINLPDATELLIRLKDNESLKSMEPNIKRALFPELLKHLASKELIPGGIILGLELALSDAFDGKYPPVIKTTAYNYVGDILKAILPEHGKRLAELYNEIQKS